MDLDRTKVLLLLILPQLTSFALDRLKGKYHEMKLCENQILYNYFICVFFRALLSGEIWPTTV